ncbi:hypothetical protein JW865_00765 [Candidatus Bathyarchaeota archaeon]|nr:hypothetical protein [Candidatus Bathyarchaeota archaeon]
MTDISLLYDRSESDEIGIKLIANDMNIDLAFLPFHKIAFGFGRKGISFRSIGKDYSQELADTKVILNRCQSKNRRIYASLILENIEKAVVNPFFVESVCASKVNNLLAFSKAGVRTPTSVYIPANVKESMPNNLELDNTRDIIKLIRTYFNSQIILKPDGGTHGRGIKLTNNDLELSNALKDVIPSIINPSGVLVQEVIPKWFYDLRIIVSKEKGSFMKCAPTAMVRGGFKDFRTNTYLGNMVFRVNLPLVIMEEAIKAGKAIAKNSEATVIALDAMPFFEDVSVYNEDKIRNLFTELEKPFNKVLKTKNDPSKKNDFKSYSNKIKDVYENYMSSKPYIKIQETLQNSLNDCAKEVVFHEANACPEFWEQTRIVGGVNVGALLLQTALSLIK